MSPLDFWYYLVYFGLLWSLAVCGVVWIGCEIWERPGGLFRLIPLVGLLGLALFLTWLLYMVITAYIE